MTHQKIELSKGCDESENNYPYTIDKRTLFDKEKTPTKSHIQRCSTTEYHYGN